MKWKDRYLIIKNGDKLKLIKHHTECKWYKLGHKCCIEDFIIGNIYNAINVTDTKVRIYGVNNNFCSLPHSCFQKVM